MSLDITVSLPAGRAALSRARIVDVARAALRAERVRHALVSVTLLERAAMARLNREHLGHTGATDVISFGFTRATPADPVIGDIYLCPAVARENAKARAVPVREELVRLVVHGVLHVLGHDHPDGDEREGSPMWRTQERIVRRLSAPRDERLRRPVSR
jgi:probable rRNA maturation factor